MYSRQAKVGERGVLFVNISIGGLLTPFAAPAVLMVADKWNWNITFMMSTFGWKAVIVLVVNALGAMLLFRKELRQLSSTNSDIRQPVPRTLPFYVPKLPSLPTPCQLSKTSCPMSYLCTIIHCLQIYLHTYVHMANSQNSLPESSGTNRPYPTLPSVPYHTIPV